MKRSHLRFILLCLLYNVWTSSSLESKSSEVGLGLPSPLENCRLLSGEIVFAPTRKGYGNEIDGVLHVVSGDSEYLDIDLL
jgi:hypothetical protein